ncbi:MULTISPECIES: helix-turn-helix domain-containing protein [Streptomyces]|uniref:Helix-turn-helix domain-containing protein n=1 Tax=Streptomyces glycanivorans TaxID=3033808 RepID=A0ABY9JN97_9ACTN|nr:MULTISPECIES: helix-turn-helix domain-containing protein [unclassified Streptomyces]WSQ81932.1 helix-turn-helix domain-containing protein [Streptomyces sp. NBC_01213]TXS12531.1 ArsR family transcriptional regulator [Streptomyces sp. wa22]WLQ68575.1 helix-turn-helix domain-containing protein [Streptomyces sp. Alt3]WSQ89261.1 helix-turn-helix domain-containing protein [Streptomyces sp. NBC_01212]WSR04732.1 helix-turn-helix domain-containing protein [Streptomyces sp. NBC_01208]
MATANLLLHPVRMRILQTLVGAGELTTAQLRDRLPDVSTASMYRHVATLTQAGILEVVHEKPVRGTVERSYQVRQDAALVDEGARTAMTKDDHRQAFTVFTGTMLADFDRYLSLEDAEPAREGVLYRQGAVWITPEEFTELVEELEAVVARRARHSAGEGSVRHVISLALVPAKAMEADGAGGIPSPDVG